MAWHTRSSSFWIMKRRSLLVRLVTLAWASLQLAAPAMAGIADASAALEAASTPLTHVEATTGESCPFVHSPDCGLCRYLSTSPSHGSSTPAFDWAIGAAAALTQTASPGAMSASLALPFGRAPPTV
jgi:hypothetical protein